MLKKGLLHLVPITLALVIIASLFPNHVDYHFHMVNYGQEAYPILTAHFVNFFDNFFERSQAAILVNLLVDLYLPYCLICLIAKNQNAGWIYLYASGIPFVMFFGWFIPQGLVHVLMLLTIFHPKGVVLFAILGGAAHREWMAGLIIAYLYRLYKENENGIAKMDTKTLLGRLGKLNS